MHRFVVEGETYVLPIALRVLPKRRSERAAQRGELNDKGAKARAFVTTGVGGDAFDFKALDVCLLVGLHVLINALSVTGLTERTPSAHTALKAQKALKANLTAAARKQAQIDAAYGLIEK